MEVEAGCVTTVLFAAGLLVEELSTLVDIENENIRQGLLLQLESERCIIEWITRPSMNKTTI